MVEEAEVGDLEKGWEGSSEQRVPKSAAPNRQLACGQDLQSETEADQGSQHP